MKGVEAWRVDLIEVRRAKEVDDSASFECLPKSDNVGEPSLCGACRRPYGEAVPVLGYLIGHGRSPEGDQIGSLDLGMSFSD